ncbi:MAG: histidine phosphatase family protein [Promethearchaeota archaeon]|jgi:broad specificity phosphatase PhoE
MQNKYKLNKIWDNEAWTEQAREVIENLKNPLFNSTSILILRHSQRYEPKITDVNQNMELTPQGRSVARLFGTKLPKNRIIRLFHSPVNRCKETAEAIHAGFEEIGGESILKGVCPVVWKIGINNKFFMAEFQKYGDLEIFFRWASGFYTIENFPPLTSYSQRAADVIWNQFKSAPKKGIDIYITHDFHLNAFRYGWLGLPPDDRWVGYLGGFIFRSEENHIIYANYGEIKTIEAPHWWKNEK